MLTPRIAQVRAAFRRKRLDGTVVEKKSTNDAGANHSEHMTRAELERLIPPAGRCPSERDTLYNPVDREKMPIRPRAFHRAASTAFIPETSLTLNILGADFKAGTAEQIKVGPINIAKSFRN